MAAVTAVEASEEALQGSQQLLYRTGGDQVRDICMSPPPKNPQVVEFVYQSKSQLVEALKIHRNSVLNIRIPDLVDMISELREMNRNAILQMAVTAWVYHALGAAVLEAECHEQANTPEDGAGGLLLFRVRLDKDYDQELAYLEEGEDLAKKIRSALVAALPGDLPARKEPSQMDQLVQIKNVKPGSVEIGGVATLSVVILIVMSVGIGVFRCDTCLYEMCPCMMRPGRREAYDYSITISELRQRGAEFEVNPDGSAKLRIPPAREPRLRCPECAIM